MTPSAAKPRILALGLNPAWQRALVFESFRPGAVNRASESLRFASGKGINFVRAAMAWGKADAIVAQFAGGAVGGLLLADLDKEGLPHASASCSPSETRVCTTVISRDGQPMTELIEPSGPVSEASAAEILALSSAELERSSALAICGTCPPGSGGVYEKMAGMARASGKAVLLDSYLGIEPVLRAGVDILKINREEISSLSGEGDCLRAMRLCLSKWGMKAVAVTDGPGEAFLALASGGLWRYSIPALPSVASPVGAGDVCSAVMFSEALSGSPLQEALACGLAAASASCLSMRCACFSVEEALRIKPSADAIPFDAM